MTYAAFAERAEQHDREATFPKADFDDLRAAGLLGLMVPERLGGKGSGFAGYVEVAYEIAQGNPATALVFNMHCSVTGALASTPDELARAMGTPEEFFAYRDRVLRDAANGALYLAAGSERGAGSRFSEMTTTYEPEGEGWRIKGHKAFCSGAGHGDGYLVVARRGDLVSNFLVPATDGLTVEQTWDPLGMRATASNDLHIDVHVPRECLLGVEGLGLLLARVMPQWLVASYAAVYVGAARAAITEATKQLQARGLHKLPAVRARLGRADAATEAAWLAVQDAARRVDEQPGDRATNRAVYRAKLLAGDTAHEVTASMLEACGTSAMRRGNPLERLFRDARCGALQPATSDVCADWLGVAALGLDPDEETTVPRW